MESLEPRANLEAAIGPPFCPFLCRTALCMLRMSCFPGGLPPSSTGGIALQPSHGRTNSCPIASDLEPLLALMLIEAPGIVQRLPGNPGNQGDQGIPMYLHHAFGARLPWSGHGCYRGLFPRKTREGQSRPSQFWWHDHLSFWRCGRACLEDHLLLSTPQPVCTPCNHPRKPPNLFQDPLFHSSLLLSTKGRGVCLARAAACLSSRMVAHTVLGGVVLTSCKGAMVGCRLSA